MSVTTETGPVVTAAGPRSRLRPEIQLLRALAVLAVVGNHLAPGIVHGGYLGVDIFFVISGYLISSHLLRELDRTGSIRLVEFWARRARRLLPASLLTLLASAVATVAVVPATMWPLVMRQIVASALYVQNWALAHDAEDYFASSNSPSPVTHFWSLSLEEQFYLVWPLLALGAYAVGRLAWGRRGARYGVLLVFGLVAAASLAYSVWETDRLPHAAYFVTPARVWQLGIGGLLSLMPPLTRGRRVTALAGWAALLGSILLFDESAPVPGWITLLPVLGAVAVIASGDVLLAALPAWTRPALTAGLWVGGISYSLYLWHWPLIVLTPYATGHPLTALTKPVVLAASLLLAWLSARFVESPVRRLRWLTAAPGWRTLVPAACGMLVMVLVGHVATGAVDGRLHKVAHQVTTMAESADSCFGARAIANRCDHPHRLRYRDSPLLRADNYTEDLVSWGRGCMQSLTGTAVVSCQFGVPRSKAVRRIAVVGDSHAHQWTAALDALAVKHRWNVEMIAKSSCPVIAIPTIYAAWDSSVATQCHHWMRLAIARVTNDRSLDAVVVSDISRRYVVPGVPKARQIARQASGYLRLWKRWTRQGKTVVALGDVPTMTVGDIPTCVARAHTFVDPCTTPASEGLAPDPLLRAARSAHDPAVVPVNLHRFFCDHGRCHSVIGGVVAYGDNSHLLAFFARTLAPYIERRLPTSLLGW